MQQIYGERNTHAEVRFQLSYKATLLKSHFGMGVLLYFYSLFSEHLFLNTSKYQKKSIYDNGIRNMLGSMY